MTYDAGMTTTERPTLTRDRVIDAAVAYADEFGLESLSMRKLGAHLGVEAMSLYNHVDNKDDLYDGMIDAIFVDIEMPDAAGSWQEQIRSIGGAAMDTFAQHAWVVTLLMTRGNYGPGSLAFMDRTVGILFEAGFDEDAAHHAWQLLASHTMGYAFQVASRDSGTFTRDEEQLAAEFALVAPQFPHVARIGDAMMKCDFVDEYRYTFDIVIAGLEARLAAQR